MCIYFGSLRGIDGRGGRYCAVLVSCIHRKRALYKDRKYPNLKNKIYGGGGGVCVFFLR